MNKHVNRNRKKPKYDRQYLGVTITKENYKEIFEKEGRDGINFHTKHLRAYLKGKSYFTHGQEIDSQGDIVGPKIHKVLAKINLVKSI